MNNMCQCKLIKSYKNEGVDLLRIRQGRLKSISEQRLIFFCNHFCMVKTLKDKLHNRLLFLPTGGYVTVCPLLAKTRYDIKELSSCKGKNLR